MIRPLILAAALLAAAPALAQQETLLRLSETAERNVRAMVRLAKDRGIDVVLLGTPEPGLTVSPPAFYEAIAEEFGVPYEGGVIGEVLRDASLKADPIHPNARGYRIIAERVAEALRRSGAL